MTSSNGAPSSNASSNEVDGSGGPAAPTSSLTGASAGDRERAATELRGIPQLLNSWLVTPVEAAELGFALYIHLGIMMRHFADFRNALEELRATGRVALEPGDTSVEPITELLRT